METSPLTRRLKLRISQIPEIKLIDLSIPHGTRGPAPKLLDILDDEVEESHRVKNHIIERMLIESDFREGLINLKTPYTRK